MRSRARAFSLAVDGVDNLRPPHGPCPPSYSQLSGPARENASALQLRGFDAETRGEGLAFAAQAAVALHSAQHEQHLRAAMATRNLIGQAQGILMERYKVTAEQAFAVLARASQESNVKLRDVAQRLIDTGETPGR
jgi:AmiR/NasT family two-component response regulator